MLGIIDQNFREDVRLTRYACDLIVQCADPRLGLVAAGQRYFSRAAQRAEGMDADEDALREEEDTRLDLRKKLTKDQKKMTAGARKCGVITPLDHAVFNDEGYRGQYDGRDAEDLKLLRGCKGNEVPFDLMGSPELAANWFRVTQTTERLRREGAANKEEAGKVHREVGKTVRKAMIEASGIPPEKLPTAESIKYVERRRRQELKEANRQSRSLFRGDDQGQGLLPFTA
jgi:DNA-damage-inducible protein D